MKTVNSGVQPRIFHKQAENVENPEGPEGPEGPIKSDKNREEEPYTSPAAPWTCEKNH